ncbi:MAG: glycerophosphodiester phosphodiesterase [Limisphaerales bacterium]|jgi:glycerophosphoryl diester phosphodiesterase|nr:glycerophosphodiester phosphodiesterase family protein [Verrucomicrobiota bacterium]
MINKTYIKLLSAAAFIAAFTFTMPSSQAADGRALKLMESDRTIVVAHRGFSMGAPENTVPAFFWGKLAEADMVELDFYVNKEGTLFCLHDRTLDRTTDIRSTLSLTNATMLDLTDAQVRKLDAGKWKNPMYAGTPMPSLEEALIAIQADGGMTLAEHKTGSAAQCAAVLTKLDCVNDLIVQSFNWNFLADMKKVLPEQITVALGPQNEIRGVKLTAEQKVMDKTAVDEMLKLGVAGAAWNKQLTPEGIEYAHSKGLKVFVYTINDIKEAQELLAMGVDGIITDNPALVWKAIATK